MSEWSGAQAEIVAGMLEEFGTDSTYVPLSGASFSIVGIFNDNKPANEPGDGAFRFSVRPADLNVLPAKGDRIVIGAKTYRVSSDAPELERVGGFFVLPVREVSA